MYSNTKMNKIAQKQMHVWGASVRVAYIGVQAIFLGGGLSHLCPKIFLTVPEKNAIG